MQSFSPRSSSTVKASSISHRTLSPETVIARARARATMEAKPSVKPLSHVPFPTIAPTRFSARWSEPTARNNPEQPSHDQEVDLPSSPPSSQAGSNNKPCLNIDIDQRSMEPRTPLQLSSPISNPGADSECEVASMSNRKISNQRHRLHQGGLTSSVVKGEAASGLLELMRGGASGDVGVVRPGGIGMCGL